MKKHAGTFVISLIVTALLVVLDQLTKILAVSFLKDAPKVLIPGVFELRYLENNGAAFGLLQNQHWLFYIITIVLSIAILMVLWKMPTDKKTSGCGSAALEFWPEHSAISLTGFLTTMSLIFCIFR